MGNSLMNTAEVGWCTKESFCLVKDGDNLILKQKDGSECGRVRTTDSGSIFEMSPPDSSHAYWWLAEKEETFENMSVDQVVWNVIQDEEYLRC